MNRHQANPPKASILIVDDIPDNLRLLSQILTDQGYEVVKALNGHMALRAAQAAPPDLILLDINMPDIEGYEVCQRLKADERTQDIPVIFISAVSNKLDPLMGIGDALHNGHDAQHMRRLRSRMIRRRISSRPRTPR